MVSVDRAVLCHSCACCTQYTTPKAWMYCSFVASTLDTPCTEPRGRLSRKRAVLLLDAVSTKRCSDATFRRSLAPCWKLIFELLEAEGARHPRVAGSSREAVGPLAPLANLVHVGICVSGLPGRGGWCTRDPGCQVTSVSRAACTVLYARRDHRTQTALTGSQPLPCLPTELVNTPAYKAAFFAFGGAIRSARTLHDYSATSAIMCTIRALFRNDAIANSVEHC